MRVDTDKERKYSQVGTLNPEPTTLTRILVIQTAFIGDVILATALLEKLHAHFPEARLDMLVRKGNESLLASHPYLNELLIWNKKEKKYSELWRTANEVRRRKYDLVVNCQRYSSSGFITWRSAAKQKIGFDKNPFSWAFTSTAKHIMDGRHEVERNQSLIAHLTDEAAERPRLYPSQDQEQKVAPLKNEPYICIAPTSVWTTKQWPAHKWVELIGRKKEFRVFLLGAPTDKEACQYIATRADHPDVVVLCGELDLLESAALMSDAEMNYVNDSAPLHLASAMNAPVRAIFCSTIPDFGFTPLSDDSMVIETEKDLECRPCGVHGHTACPLGHFECAESISAERVARR